MLAILPEVIPTAQITPDYCKVIPPGNTLPDMENVYELRRQRLKSVINDRFDGNQSRFAVEVGTVPPHVNQILSGKKRMGEGLARRIEIALGLGLSPKYMDLGPGLIDAVINKRPTVNAATINEDFVSLADANRMGENYLDVRRFEQEEEDAILSEIVTALPDEVSRDQIEIDGRLISHFGIGRADIVAPGLAIDLISGTSPNLVSRISHKALLAKEAIQPLRYYVVYWPGRGRDARPGDAARWGTAIRPRVENLLGKLRERGYITGYTVISDDASDIHEKIFDML